MSERYVERDSIARQFFNNKKIPSLQPVQFIDIPIQNTDETAEQLSGKLDVAEEYVEESISQMATTQIKSEQTLEKINAVEIHKNKFYW